MERKRATSQTSQHQSRPPTPKTRQEQEQHEQEQEQEDKRKRTEGKRVWCWRHVLSGVEDDVKAHWPWVGERRGRARGVENGQVNHGIARSEEKMI